MRTPLYRLPGLQIEKSSRGWSWRCWIVVAGRNIPAQGTVENIGDLENSLMDRVREVYKNVVGSPLPDSTP